MGGASCSADPPCTSFLLFSLFSAGALCIALPLVSCASSRMAVVQQDLKMTLKKAPGAGLMYRIC